MDVLSTDIKNINSILAEAYACRVNNLKKSVSLAKSALDQSKELNSPTLIANSLNHLSLFYMILGDYGKALSMANEALKYYQNVGDDLGVANAKFNIAGVYYKTDNFHMGLVYLIDCLGVFKTHNDYYNISRVYKSLGTIYEYFGDLNNAIKTYKGSIRAARQIKDSNLESNAYNPLSGIYLKQNEIDKATDLIEKSIQMKTKTNDIRGLAFAIYGRGKIYASLKKYDLAEKDYLHSLKLHTEMGERLGLGMTYNKLGKLYIQIKEYRKAHSILTKSIEFSNSYNMVMIKYKANYLLYTLFKDKSEPIKALVHLELYFKQKEAVINAQTLKVIENYEFIKKMDSLRMEARLEKEKAEIIDKKNRAEHAAKVKQDFLSTMSHEIRTPLNAVITISSLLGFKSQKEEKPLLESLKYAANNLLLLINDVLDFTKLESDKVNLEMRPYDIRKLLQNIEKTYINMADEKGIQLILDINKNIGKIYELDQTKLSQILGNLVSNAIKFTEKGSVTIKLSKIKSINNTDVVKFEIIDTGIGIQKKHLESIFESFYQPNVITTRKKGGTGLGLAIVKKLVEIHGSQIGVSSKINSGSNFTFDLKLKKGILLKKETKQKTIELKGKTVLLAEDNMINAMVHEKLLSNWGLTTKHAKNGIEAVDLAKSTKFDFILMDIHMPEMDGFEATSQIRNTKNINKKTPLFALSADITAENNIDLNIFDGFLRKPIELDKLQEALLR